MPWKTERFEYNAMESRRLLQSLLNLTYLRFTIAKAK